jgi:hypothetical protein
LEDSYTQECSSGIIGDAKEILLKRINGTRDAVVGDGDNILPINFPVVGTILLEFMEALSEHLGWTGMYREHGKADEFLFVDTPDAGLEVKWIGLLHRCGRLLSCIDREGNEFDVDRVSAFTETFFDKIEESRYNFHV